MLNRTARVPFGVNSKKQTVSARMGRGAVTFSDSSNEISDDSKEDKSTSPCILVSCKEPLKVKVGSQGCKRELILLVSGTIPGQVSDSDNSESDFEDIP